MSFVTSHIGELYSIAAALTWSVAVIFYRKGGETVTPVAMNLFKSSFALVLFFISMAIAKVPLFNPQASVSDWLILFASGAVGIFVADTLFFAALNRIGATGSAILDCLYGPFVVIASVVYLGEPLGLPLMFALILMGMAIFLGGSEKIGPFSRGSRRWCPPQRVSPSWVTCHQSLQPHHPHPSPTQAAE